MKQNLNTDNLFQKEEKKVKMQFLFKESIDKYFAQTKKSIEDKMQFSTQNNIDPDLVKVDVEINNFINWINNIYDSKLFILQIDSTYIIDKFFHNQYIIDDIRPHDIRRPAALNIDKINFFVKSNRFYLAKQDIQDLLSNVKKDIESFILIQSDISNWGTKYFDIELKTKEIKKQVADLTNPKAISTYKEYEQYKNLQNDMQQVLNNLSQKKKQHTNDITFIENNLKILAPIKKDKITKFNNLRYDLLYFLQYKFLYFFKNLLQPSAQIIKYKQNENGKYTPEIIKYDYSKKSNSQVTFVEINKKQQYEQINDLNQQQNKLNLISNAQNNTNQNPNVQESKESIHNAKKIIDDNQIARNNNNQVIIDTDKFHDDNINSHSKVASSNVSEITKKEPSFENYQISPINQQILETSIKKSLEKLKIDIEKIKTSEIDNKDKETSELIRKNYIDCVYKLLGINLFAKNNHEQKNPEIIESSSKENLQIAKAIQHIYLNNLNKIGLSENFVKQLDSTLFSEMQNKINKTFSKIFNNSKSTSNQIC